MWTKLDYFVLRMLLCLHRFGSGLVQASTLGTELKAPEVRQPAAGGASAGRTSKEEDT